MWASKFSPACSNKCEMGGDFEDDFEEEDDGYYSSSEDEGPVTAKMAVCGVGEAGRVVVAESIYNKLVPKDLLGVYEKAQWERRSERKKTRASGQWGPINSMLESLRVDTGGLRVTLAPPPLPACS